MKNYLFVMRRAPHNGIHIQETLDMLLTTAAFDQHVTVLFVDDGVLQLKQQQQPDTMQLKDTAAIFSVLALYDVRELYVETESLTARALGTTDLILPVQQIPRVEIGAFMQQHDVILPD